ncbi:MAG: hypothetical protein GX575_18285 [Candidatus Anammoximicrobium sp.]|nr:hypothetical protein [Candidatus Anammoximicrobium sp.]
MTRALVRTALWGLTLTVAATGAAAERWVVQNERMAVTFTAEARGGVTSLVDKATGRELAARQAQPRLFQLEFSSPGSTQRLTVSNSDAQGIEFTDPDADGGAAALHFTRLGGQPIDVVCRVAAKPQEPWLRWRIEAKYPSSLMLETVQFPIVTLTLGGEATPGDALVLGATKGGVYRQPSAWKAGRSISASQPGSLAAQMACYYDPAVGLLAAALDARGYRKAVVASKSDAGLALVWQHPCLSSSGFQLDYDIALATFRSADSAVSTDWRDGADLYKAWAVKQAWCRRTFAARDDLPAWLKTSPAMVRFGRNWLAEPGSIEAWLNGYWKRRFPGDVPLIIAYWGWEKVDTWITPDYFPAFPSDDEFRRLVEIGRQLNGHTFLWPSGYHYTLTYRKLPTGEFEWDDRERFDRVAKPHAIHNRDGQVLIGDRSWLQGGQTATMCPGDPWTIDWFNRLATGCAERGAELIQVDQVVGGNFPVCYATSHGHPPGPGPWATDVFRRQLQTMLQKCRKIQPESVVCFEEPNEHFIQEVGLQDYRDWEVMRRGDAEPASVFNYLYHEYLPTFQSNPQAGNRLQAAHCLVTGQIPHLVPSSQTGPGPLLAGGDFEKWRGAVPTGWDKVPGYRDRTYSGQADRDESAPHGGQASLRLTNQGPDEIAQVSQNVTVGQTFAVGRTYRVSAWIKTQGIRQRNAILLGAFAPELKHLGSWRLEMPAEQEGWVQRQAQFTLPEGTQLLRIMLHLQGPGTAWIDDVKLEQLSDDGPATEVQRPETPSDHDFMLQWVQLFHGKGRPYLALGKMIHPPRLDVGATEFQNRRFPAILHEAYVASDGTRAAILVNASDTPQTGTLHAGGKATSITLAPGQARLVRLPDGCVSRHP